MNRTYGIAIGGIVVVVIAWFFLKDSSELPRDEARRILDEYFLQNPSVTVLFISQLDIEKAQTDGILKVSNAKLNCWFTDSAFEKVKGLIGKNNVDITLPDYPGACALAQPIPHKVFKITGIAKGNTPETRIVEYDAEFVIPPESEPVIRYFGMIKKRSILRRFDDGWRVEQIKAAR